MELSSTGFSLSRWTWGRGMLSPWCSRCGSSFWCDSLGSWAKETAVVSCERGLFLAFDCGATCWAVQN